MTPAAQVCHVISNTVGGVKLKLLALCVVVFVSEMALRKAPFDLDRFIQEPSLDQIDACRKDDLAVIADHYDIPWLKQSRKKDLRAVVVAGLVDRRVLVVSEVADDTAEPPVVAGPSGGVGSGDAEQKVQLGLDEQSEDSEEGDRPATPVTLPRFDPLLTDNSSGTSPANVRLKLRLARLQMEAHEKAQQRQFQLEIRKLEIEADKAVRLRQLELSAQASATSPSPSVAPSGSQNPTALPFDITRSI